MPVVGVGRFAVLDDGHTDADDISFVRSLSGSYSVAIQYRLYRTACGRHLLLFSKIWLWLFCFGLSFFRLSRCGGCRGAGFRSSFIKFIGTLPRWHVNRNVAMRKFNSVFSELLLY